MRRKGEGGRRRVYPDTPRRLSALPYLCASARVQYTAGAARANSPPLSLLFPTCDSSDSPVFFSFSVSSLSIPLLSELIRARAQEAAAQIWNRDVRLVCQLSRSLFLSLFISLPLYPCYFCRSSSLALWI